MKRFTIITLLSLAYALFLNLVLLDAIYADDVQPPVAKRPVPVVHITDLYRPHEDPDDHWDLAVQYALAARGDTKLVAIVLDYPNQQVKNPDISAVAQLNFITGMAVPAMTGVPGDFPLDTDMKDPAVRNSPELSGVRALHRILRDSPEPVVITVTGWCRDLMFIYKYDPELFKEKCAGVYLNAGLGAPTPDHQKELEWNALIDPIAYGEAFKLPVPVYWLPCFHTRDREHYGPESYYGSFFHFNQGEILPELSKPMQNYFLAMFRDGGKRPGWTDWLTVLSEEPNQIELEKQSKSGRLMWCTAGMLHMVGKTVLADGSIVPIAEADGKAIYEFLPIKIECDKESRTSWKFNKGTDANKGPFVFKVPDRDKYHAGMGKALKTLVLEIGAEKKK